MENVTLLMRFYARKACSVWNDIFLCEEAGIPDWDTVDDFRRINGLLFRRLVAEQLGLEFRDPQEMEFRKDAIEGLIVASDGMAPLEVWGNRVAGKDGSGYWDYTVEVLAGDEARFSFIGYFDFDHFARREFEFCLVWGQSFARCPEMEGRLALIPSGRVKFFVED